MIRRARRSVLMVDGSKFDRPALSVVASAGDVTTALAADVTQAALTRLAGAGIDARAV
jgi:DeoR/GlpR family transcriptional regulator of sugar metabolism